MQKDMKRGAHRHTRDMLFRGEYEQLLGIGQATDLGLHRSGG
jgi:hypothetical protein